MNGFVEWGSRRPLFSLFFLFLYPSCFPPYLPLSLPSLHFHVFVFLLFGIFIYYDFFLYVHFSLMCFAVDTLFSHSILPSTWIVTFYLFFISLFFVFFVFFFFFFAPASIVLDPFETFDFE
ncbi:hypothetical protein I7I53_05728 [Histoplasma capsulatum var. duboisii H88]|uniref:Uncharacterized protein n=1 Tax=Ajellomyces capsulatus (strain H88) TaxID=544711 RepID=A0A8A1LXZ4_AJEC8|nr:hypothetical protein I7I53_05728 [Histoplasma capsulatum var. duboisii H88]